MNYLTSNILLLTAALSACAQQEGPAPPVVAKQKPTPEEVYTYVEQMPELPGSSESA